MLKKGILGLIALLASLLSVVWFVDFDASELGAAALGHASASSRMRLEASSYRINLLRGLEVEDVEARVRVPGARYSVEMPAMRFEHRVLSLLGGPLEIERVVLSEPRVTIATGLQTVPREAEPPSPSGRGPSAPSEETPPGEPLVSPVELRVRALELERAAIAFNDELFFDGVDISLESPALASGGLTLLHAVDASGRISIRELAFRNLTVRNISAGLDLAEGRLALSDGAFEIDRGSFGVDIQLDLNSIPARYRLALTGRLVGVPGEVTFDGEGFGMDARNLKGDGRWVVPAGRFDDAPVWRSLELTGSAYEATEISFEVSGGRLELDGVWIRGSVGLGGDLDLVISGREVGGTWDAPVVR